MASYVYQDGAGWVALTSSSLPASGVTAGTYGDATHSSQVTIAASGIVTAASSVAITGGGGGGTIGNSSLIYRYTVAGSDKASIDTGVDAPDAGSNDWTNGDALEVLIAHRTDDAAATSAVNITVNNDGGANYDRAQAGAFNGAFDGTLAAAQTAWAVISHGSGGSAGYAETTRLTIPDYAGTVFNKVAESAFARADATAGNVAILSELLGWRSTAAITRLKLAAQSTAKLKVGTQLLIYKRLAS